MILKESLKEKRERHKKREPERQEKRGVEKEQFTFGIPQRPHRIPFQAHHFDSRTQPSLTHNACALAKVTMETQ